MAMTEEEQIMGAEIRKTLMDAVMRAGRTGAGRIGSELGHVMDPGFIREIPADTPPSIPMPSPSIPPGYGNPETMDPGFMEMDPGFMDKSYTPDEIREITKRRMLEELWRRREIEQSGGIAPIPKGSRGEIVPIPDRPRGSRGEMIPIPNYTGGGRIAPIPNYTGGGEIVPIPELGHSQQYQGERFSIEDLIRSFRESEKQF